MRTYEGSPRGSNSPRERRGRHRSSSQRPPLHTEDAEALLRTLRETARRYGVENRPPQEGEKEELVRQAGRLIVQRPALSLRHLIFALEAAAHEQGASPPERRDVRQDGPIGREGSRHE